MASVQIAPLEQGERAATEGASKDTVRSPRFNADGQSVAKPVTRV